jgi:hypothetical protein
MCGPSSRQESQKSGGGGTDLAKDREKRALGPSMSDGKLAERTELDPMKDLQTCRAKAEPGSGPRAPLYAGKPRTFRVEQTGSVCPDPLTRNSAILVCSDLAKISGRKKEMEKAKFKSQLWPHKFGDKQGTAPLRDLIFLSVKWADSTPHSQVVV